MLTRTKSGKISKAHELGFTSPLRNEKECAIVHWSSAYRRVYLVGCWTIFQWTDEWWTEQARRRGNVQIDTVGSADCYRVQGMPHVQRHDQNHSNRSNRKWIGLICHYYYYCSFNTKICHLLFIDAAVCQSATAHIFVSSSGTRPDRPDYLDMIQMKLRIQRHELNSDGKF